MQRFKTLTINCYIDGVHHHHWIRFDTRLWQRNYYEHIMHLLRKFYIRGEGVRRCVEWLIRRLIKVGAKFSYHARRWQVQVLSAFPLRHHYLAVIDSG
ncbi:MAG: hypothetical protein QF832_03620 [SAR324 cluster bacterium]|nr:hypothetical protein [SAR324 cluster bacterium]